MSRSLTKLVPNVLNIGLAEAFEQEPGFAEARKKDPRVDDVLNVALRLEGLARNCSVHAAGVVISPQPLKELVPAVQDEPRRNCDAVRHERPRQARSF